MSSFGKDFQMISRVENEEGFWIVSTINKLWEDEPFFETVIIEGDESELDNYMTKQNSEHFEKTKSETMDEAIHVHREKRFLLQNNKIKLNAEKTRRKLADNIINELNELRYKTEFEEIDKELIKEIEKHLLNIRTSIDIYNSFQEINSYSYKKEVKSADIEGVVYFDKDKKINKKEQQQLCNILFSNTLFFVKVYEDKLEIDGETWLNDLEIEEAFKKVMEDFFIPKKIKIKGVIEITREGDHVCITPIIKFIGDKIELTEEVMP